MSDHKAQAEALDIALYGKPDIYTPPEEFMPRRAAIAAKLAELYSDRDAVDHKAEAQRLTETVTRAHGIGVLPANTIFALAQVHATLALAEQQRIANLIAIATAENDLLRALPDASPFATVFAQIREGLGL